MLMSGVCSRVSRLGVPIPELLSGVFSLGMTLAGNSGMCLNSEGSNRGGPYGAGSMGRSMGATPSAVVLKVVIHLSNDSGAGFRGRSGRGTRTGVAICPRLSNFLILFSTVSKYLIMLSTQPCCCNSVPSR